MTQMGPDEDINEAVLRALKKAGAAAAQFARQQAQRQQDDANRTRAEALDAAKRDQERIAALVATARADMVKINDPAWWDRAEQDPDEFARTWQTAHDLAGHDPSIADARARMEAEAQRRWGIDPATVATPVERTAGTANPLRDAAAGSAADQMDRTSEAQRALDEAALAEEARDVERTIADQQWSDEREAFDRASAADVGSPEQRTAVTEAQRAGNHADVADRRADEHGGEHDSQERRAELAERAAAGGADQQAIGARVRASEAQAHPASHATKQPKKGMRRMRRTAGVARGRQSELER